MKIVFKTNLTKHDAIIDKVGADLVVGLQTGKDNTTPIIMWEKFNTFISLNSKGINLSRHNLKIQQEQLEEAKLANPDYNCYLRNGFIYMDKK